MKNKILKYSITNLIISIVLFAFNYFFFHFVTDDGITSWHEEAGKPFVTNLIGILATLFLFLGIASLIASFIFFSEDKK